MKQTLLLICIAVCVCAARAAENEAPTPFRDYLRPTKASAMSGYRYGVESESMCFETTDYCSKSKDRRPAPTFGPPSPPPPSNKNDDVETKNVLEELACTECQSAHYAPHYGSSDEGFTNEITVPMSLCQWTLFKDDDCQLVPNSKNKMEICGTYQGTCYLDDDKKNGCKFPDTCEDTVLTIQGVIYEVEDAIRIGKEAKPTRCGRSEGRGAGAEKTAPPPTETSTKAGVKNSSYDDKDVEVGEATVLSGTFTVMARHPLKFKAGWHTYTYFDGRTRSKDYERVKDHMKLPDHVHRFDFVGEVKHPY